MNKNDHLIYGKKYHCWLEGKYLGVATYTDDENIGDAFLVEKEPKRYDVYQPDEWEMVNECNASAHITSAQPDHITDAFKYFYNKCGVQQPNFYVGKKVKCIADKQFTCECNVDCPEGKPLIGNIYTVKDVYLDDDNNQWLDLKELPNDQAYCWDCFEIYTANPESEKFAESVLSNLVDDMKFLNL